MSQFGRMVKQNFGTEIGKGRIHDGRYVITLSGHTVHINVWAHGSHGQDTHEIKGVAMDQYDAGEVGNKLRTLAERMRTLKQMAKKWGIEHFMAADSVRHQDRKTVQSANETAIKFAPKNPLKRIQV